MVTFKVVLKCWKDAHLLTHNPLHVSLHCPHPPDCMKKFHPATTAKRYLHVVQYWTLFLGCFYFGKHWMFFPTTGRQTKENHLRGLLIVLSLTHFSDLSFSSVGFFCFPLSAKEGPVRCRPPKSMWTSPSYLTESAGQRCVSSAFLFLMHFSWD